MLNNLTSDIDFHAQALVLRAQRQQILASNIANADTPGYAARAMNFQQAMQTALGSGGGLNAVALAAPSRATAQTSSGQIALGGMATPSAGAMSSSLVYGQQAQPALDNNSVDLDQERANFVDNSVRYEATLRFITDQAKTMISAIQGQ